MLRHNGMGSIKIIPISQTVMCAYDCKWTDVFGTQRSLQFLGPYLSSYGDFSWHALKWVEWAVTEFTDCKSYHDRSAVETTTVARTHHVSLLLFPNR
jgi:hypothetical protein